MLFCLELTKRKAIRCKHNRDLCYLAYPAYCCIMTVVEVVVVAGLLHLVALVSIAISLYYGLVFLQLTIQVSNFSPILLYSMSACLSRSFLLSIFFA